MLFLGPYSEFKVGGPGWGEGAFEDTLDTVGTASSDTVVSLSHLVWLGDQKYEDLSGSPSSPSDLCGPLSKSQKLCEPQFSHL